jgi:hypothetical protein
MIKRNKKFNGDNKKTLLLAVTSISLALEDFYAAHKTIAQSLSSTSEIP